MSMRMSRGDCRGTSRKGPYIKRVAVHGGGNAVGTDDGCSEGVIEEGPGNEAAGVDSTWEQKFESQCIHIQSLPISSRGL